MGRDSGQSQRIDYQKKIELLNRLSKLLELLRKYFEAMAQAQANNHTQKEKRNFKNVFQLIQR